jgi:hypothetical protein
MSGSSPTTTDRTCVDLEFDTPDGGAPLGDIAASLVSLHDLLRDLATLAAYPSGAEFREIQVVAIEMRRPLKIRLSLLAISADAVKAFQEICRDIIFFREHRADLGLKATDATVDPRRQAKIKAALDLVLPAAGNEGHITDTEAQRLYGHIVALQNAEVHLKRVVVKKACNA